MALRSLRARLFVAVVLWTIGVIAVVTAVVTSVIFHFSHWQGIVHNAMLIVIAVGCAVAGAAQFHLRRAMSQFNDLRGDLQDIRTGRARTLEGAYPSEIQPLVSDLNALLEDREERVMRALAQAGDLAHGLKTPLAVLAQEAARAEASGAAELGDTIAAQVARMRRQVDYHLANARAAVSRATPGARCSVRESADGLARTLLKLHANRSLRLEVIAGADHQVRVRREDLDEMLGNLLDNACTWARTQVTLSSAIAGTAIVITIDDDGPGIPAAMRDAVPQRGVRADEAASGSGFGLAIVRELADLHGGSVALGESPAGGARATLKLPRAT